MKTRTMTAGLTALSLVLGAQSALAETPSTVGATYRAASATEALAPGEKIADLFTLNMRSRYILQKLTDRTYWYQSGFYGTTWYVGDEGVLLFDPLQGQAAKILEAVRATTDLPITTIVYSHDHADHIGGTPDLLGLLADQTEAPRILASQQTADKMDRLSSKLPRPQETVSWPRGSFTFEGLTVELHGFDHAAHTDDHSAWLLTGERVLHAPDLLNADQPPFWSFAGSETFTYLQDNLREADALDWTYMNGGHGNVGAHEDIAFHLAFIDDLVAAVGTAMGEVPWGFGVDPATLTAHTAMLPAWYEEIARRATEAMRPKYGDYYGFNSATPANAEMVAEYLFSYQ
uniref:Hydrolase n=2 Tax=Alloyangia mangrovi TaxID=1779329 RepID=A0A2A3K291_9RHOB